MSKHAAKRDSDGSIVMLNIIKGDAQSALDRHSEAAGDGPYTLMNEITDEAAQMPASRYSRNEWEDDGSGDVQVDMTAAKVSEKTKAREPRDTKLQEYDATEQRIESMIRLKTRLSESTTALETDRDAVEDYKQDLRDLGATIDTDVDALTDGDGIESYAATMPTEPTLS